MARIVHCDHASYYMKHILLVFTGGTIGSQLANGTIDTDRSAAYRLIQLFRANAGCQAEIEFKTLQPLQILSENLHPRAWPAIINAIEAEDLNAYDGIIVTHGTDSLAYSAAMLGIYFNNLKLPLMLVSSDKPLDDPTANGLANFICAVEFIRQRVALGVYVPYRNPGSTLSVHLGTRLHSCLPLSSDFISVHSQALANFSDGRFSSLPVQPKPEPSPQPLRSQFARILMIRPYPGLDYSNFNLDKVDVILHDLYHSGTACVSPQWGETHSLIAFSQRCKQLAIPLYLAPAIYSENAYRSTRQLLDHGAKILWNVSLESAYAKLALAYGNFSNPRDIDDFLSANIAGERV